MQFTDSSPTLEPPRYVLPNNTPYTYHVSTNLYILLWKPIGYHQDVSLDFYPQPVIMHSSVASRYNNENVQAIQKHHKHAYIYVMVICDTFMVKMSII